MYCAKLKFILCRGKSYQSFKLVFYAKLLYSQTIFLLCMVRLVEIQLRKDSQLDLKGL